MRLMLHPDTDPSISNPKPKGGPGRRPAREGTGDAADDAPRHGP